MALADAHGLSIATLTRSASPAEVSLVHETLEQNLLADAPRRLIADRAYDSDRLARSLAHEGTEFISPHRSNRVNITQDGRKLRRYKRRWKVERLFAWRLPQRSLKQNSLSTPTEAFSMRAKSIEASFSGTNSSAA
jgi:transposase